MPSGNEDMTKNLMTLQSYKNQQHFHHWYRFIQRILPVSPTACTLAHDYPMAMPPTDEKNKKQ
jgi:hypothetical protein